MVDSLTLITLTHSHTLTCSSHTACLSYLCVVIVTIAVLSIIHKSLCTCALLLMRVQLYACNISLFSHFFFFLPLPFFFLPPFWT